MSRPRAGLPSTVQGIVFDVDGTLYDQHGLRWAMARMLVSDCFTNPRSGVRSVRFLMAYRQAHESLRGQTHCAENLSSRQLAIACERTGVSPDEGERILSASFHAAPVAQIRQFARPGLTRVLETARSRGIRLGVYSDYPAEAKLDAMGVTQYFDRILSSSDPQVGRLKPDPAGLILCMGRLGVEPENTLYVGDRTDVDAECASRAGACPVIVSSRARAGYTGLQIRGFDDLAALLFT